MMICNNIQNDNGARGGRLARTNWFNHCRARRCRRRRRRRRSCINDDGATSAFVRACLQAYTTRALVSGCKFRQPTTNMLRATVCAVQSSCVFWWFMRLIAKQTRVLVMIICWSILRLSVCESITIITNYIFDMNTAIDPKARKVTISWKKEGIRLYWFHFKQVLL